MANYESQDFIDTYQELLDTMKEQTKYDPSTSSEADPGVVLLKLIALLKDKLDYKIDMSEAQAYLDTVTDRQAAFDLLQMLGYSMKNAKSATGQVLVSSRSNATNFTLPLFSVITDENSSLSFFTTKEVELSELGDNTIESVQQIVPVMEGTLFSIEKEGYDVFSLKDIDEDGRFFLQKSGLAQNGVFILDENDQLGEDPWINLESSNIYPQGKYYYILSDANGENYIQFPQNFEELIGASNFKVKATYTIGSAGNVKKGTLVKTAQNSSDFNIRQTVDITSGSDEEDIQQAVQNYYSSLGVFNTLVTKSDFENAIRFLLKNGRRLFSNAFVKTAFDRRIEIVTNSGGKNYKVFEKLDDNDDPQEIQATCLSYGSGYDDSFEYATNEIADDDLDILVNNLLENSKELLSNVVMTPKGRYLAVTDLTGNLFVNATSSTTLFEIRQKLQTRLQERFSARNLTFGQKLDYQVLINTIKAVDNKISALALNSPEYQIYSDYDFTTGVGTALTAKEYTDVQAKAVLSGATPLFKFANRKNSAVDQNTDYLNIPFGAASYVKLANMGDKIEISDIIISKLEDQNAPLSKNCLIQVCKDSIRADVQYGYGVYYKLIQRFPLNSAITVEDNGTTVVAAGTILAENSKIIADGTSLSVDLEALLVNNTIPKNKSYVVKSQINLAKGSIISAGSEIGVNSKINGDTASYVPKEIQDGDIFTTGNGLSFKLQSSSGNIDVGVGEKFKPVGLSIVAQSVEDWLGSDILGPSETIEHMVKDSAIIEEDYYYFLRLNNQSSLTLEKDNYYILQDNEYFVYSDNALESYVLLGAGTKLSLPDGADGPVVLTKVINKQLDDTDSESFERLGVQIITTATEVQTFEGPRINLGLPEIGSWTQLEDKESLDIEVLESATIKSDGSVDYVYEPTIKFIGSDYSFRPILSIQSDLDGVASITDGVTFTLTITDKDGKSKTIMVKGNARQKLVCSSAFSSLFSENTKQGFLADGESASLAAYSDDTKTDTGITKTLENGVLTIRSTGGNKADIPIVKQTESFVQFQIYIQKAVREGKTPSAITVENFAGTQELILNTTGSAVKTLSFYEGDVATISADSLGSSSSGITIDGLKSGDVVVLSMLSQILDYSDEIKYVKTDNDTMISTDTPGYYNNTFSGFSDSEIVAAINALDKKKIFNWSALSDGTLSHPTKPESFFSSFHPYNKQVLPYIKKDLSKIKINSNFGG